MFSAHPSTSSLNPPRPCTFTHQEKINKVPDVSSGTLPIRFKFRTSLLPVFKELRVKPSMIPISKTSGIPSQAAKTVPRFTKVTRADTLQVAPLAKAWKACEGIYVVDCHGFLVMVSIKLKTKLLRKPDFFFWDFISSSWKKSFSNQ